MMTSAIEYMKWTVLVGLLLLGLPSSAQQETPLRQWAPGRNIFLSGDEPREVPEVFLAGENVTTLRFEAPCDPARTTILGWEGRFEPLLVGGRSVVIVPTRDLDPKDRFLLRVTSMDGTEMPFTLTAGSHRVDGQVNIYSRHESSRALRAELEEEQHENSLLREVNSRYEKEQTSDNHLLAALLANGHASMLPFRRRQKWAQTGDGIAVDIAVLDDGKRVAVLFLFKNLDSKQPWKLQEARLSTSTTGETREFALRMNRAEIPPGQTGQIAVVMDMSSFDTPKGLDKLVLEIFRNGGLMQAFALLERRTTP